MALGGDTRLLLLSSVATVIRGEHTPVATVNAEEVIASFGVTVSVWVSPS